MGIEAERDAWNTWNAANRESSQSRVSLEQAGVVEGWLRRLVPGGNADILEVGCGTGWMSERLTAWGQVTGLDLADEVIDRARRRVPDVTFYAGDFLAADLGRARFDVVVSLETISHVADQPAFLHRIAELLRPGGHMMLATQNRPVMERNLAHLPNHGWRRHWVDRDELTGLVTAQFDVNELRSITPIFFSGPLHVLNSSRLEALADRIGLQRPLRRVKRFEEDHDLGWTLMCLAHLHDRAVT